MAHARLASLVQAAIPAPNKYENYPTCSEIKCTVPANCNGHADAVSGTLVTGCTCTCSTGFTGASCDSCANKYESYPTCSEIKCTAPANCNGHADAVSGTLVTGCTCTCSTGFTGASCDSCANKYENYPTCSEIKCTVPANCNGHADAVSGTLVTGLHMHMLDWLHWCKLRFLR